MHMQQQKWSGWPSRHPTSSIGALSTCRARLLHTLSRPWPRALHLVPHTLHKTIKVITVMSVCYKLHIALRQPKSVDILLVCVMCLFIFIAQIDVFQSPLNISGLGSYYFNPALNTSQYRLLLYLL